MRRSSKSFSELSDPQSKLVLERINLVEKSFGEMCSSFAALTRKTARLRDKNDDLAKVLQNYSESEKFNKSLSIGVSSVSKAMSFIADFHEMEVKRMETKVVAELSQYEIICRNSREDFKNSVVNRDKEINRKKQLDLIKQRNLRDRMTNTDSEMMKSKLELNKCNKEVEEIVESFEKRKLQDLKTVLMDFIQIEMKQHSKALEVLTATYQDLSDIDENKDFKGFKKHLKGEDYKPNSLFMQRFRSQSTGALNSIFSTPSTRRRSQVNLNHSSNSLNSPEISPRSSRKDHLREDIDGSLDSMKDESVASTTISSEDEDDEEEEVPTESEKLNPPIPHAIKLKSFCEGIELPSLELPSQSENNNSTKSNFENRKVFVRSINGVAKFFK